MFLQSLQDRTGTRRVDGYFALVSLPAQMGQDVVETVFVGALRTQLQTTGLGRVTALTVETDDDSAPVRFYIALSLVTDTPRALAQIATALERLGAPTGSTVGHAECPVLFQFGKPFGPGHYSASSDRGTPVHVPPSPNTQPEFALEADQLNRMADAVALASARLSAPRAYAKRLH